MINYNKQVAHPIDSTFLYREDCVDLGSHLGLPCHDSTIWN